MCMHACVMKRTYSFDLETTTFAQQWLSLLKKPDDHCTAVGQEGVGLLSIATKMVPRPRFSVFIRVVEHTC